MEFFRSNFYCQKRNISHIKSQSAAANLTFVLVFPIHFTLKWHYSCQRVLVPGTGAIAMEEPALCLKCSSQHSLCSESVCSTGTCRTALHVDSGCAFTRSCMPLLLSPWKDPSMPHAAVAERTGHPASPSVHILRPVTPAVQVVEVIHEHCCALAVVGLLKLSSPWKRDFEKVPLFTTVFSVLQKSSAGSLLFYV